MTNEFDKEMDSLLRQAAQSGTFVSKTPETHVDADEISLFAENVLPAKSRTRVMEHLADCERCRKILSNVIALNSEAESENVHASEKADVISKVAPIPWYKKLF